MEKIFSRKTLSIIGMVVGLAFVIVGILTIAGVFGSEISHPTNIGIGYEHGFATFGGDYYTYSSNNAADAAHAAYSATNNIVHLAEFLFIFFGLFSMLFGLVVTCGFGIVFSSCIQPVIISGTSSTTSSESEEKVSA